MQPQRLPSTPHRGRSANGGDITTVFRVPNGAASARSSVLAADVTYVGEVNQRQRGGAIAPVTSVDSVSPSFASTTNAELAELSIKTFSEDSDDSRSSIDHLLIRHRRQNPIFRPVSGSKRHYNVCDESDDEIVCRSPIRQRLSPSPQLCLANAIGSDEGICNESCYDEQSIHQYWLTSIASPVPLPSNVTPSASPFSVFFAEARAQIHAEGCPDHPLSSSRATLGDMKNLATSVNNRTVTEKEETRES
ncbi:hypothetical protein THAOC_05709 [Thalassiosira oceanica]|uniref:Uncharacterized protein n=1 Tax=Thalassiosira oceanica TaxID=159749 RepID=K0T6R9_THAOC|nr:hypothetical protein THAOC_05709 [Thalassiosira oceanica]|eukprot:EJK72729.1 hypothetical protein THAOC_05709 [Thalassiosira oceanica]